MRKHHLQLQETEQVYALRRCHRPPLHLTANFKRLICAKKVRMNQDKPRKAEAIKYGDVFSVSSELAAKPITPKDAATLQSAENLILGEIPAAGMSSVMRAAADLNERRGLVRHDDATDAVREGGAVIAETTIAGHRVIAESIGGQLLGRFAHPMDVKKGNGDDGESTGSPN